MDTAVIHRLNSVEESTCLEENTTMKEDNNVVGMEYVWFDSLVED